MIIYNARKRIAALLLAVLMLMAFVMSSCSPSDKNPETSDTVKGTDATEAPTVTKEPETDLPAEPYLKLFDGKEWNCKLIKPDTQSETISGALANGLYSEFATVFGKQPEFATDVVYRGQSIDPTAFELLIGETNRDESTKLVADLQAAGGERFGIYTSEYKVAIAGTSGYTTYLALKYVLENYIKDENGTKVMEFEKSQEYISEKTENIVPDFADAAANGVKLAFYAKKKVVSIDSGNNDYGTVQGGGTDGTYAYYGVIGKDNEYGLILKYDLKTWELVKVSKPIHTYHTNDITYDSVHNRLVVSCCTDKDGYLGMCFVDPETLEVQSYFHTTVAQRAVEYLPETNQYLLGTNYFFTLVDETFQNELLRFNCGSGRYTTQGMCCDDKYVYDVRWRSGSKVQTIVVHGLDGTYYGEIGFYGTTGEPENMFRIGDKFYVGFNQSDCVYEVELCPVF